jgi:hypothetical protein
MGVPVTSGPPLACKRQEGIHERVFPFTGRQVTL